MSVRGMASDVVDNWALGVITAILPDRLPDGAVASARNTQFYHVGPQQAVLGTRMGATVQNASPLAGSARSQYYLNTGGADYHILSLSNGNVITLTSGVPTTIGTGSLTDTTAHVHWASFENWAFGLNATDKIKTNGTTVQRFGIAEPNIAHWTAAVAAGGTNLPTGNYRVTVTWVNSLTGYESPESAPQTVTIGAGQRIQVTLPSITTIGDNQVTHAKMYLEQSGVRNAFFLVAAGTSVAIGANGWALAGGSTTIIYIDCTQPQMDVFTVLSPGVNNNYPPPAGAEHIAVHQQRVFVATATDVYWSDVGKPEYFNTVDHVLPVGDYGESITALAVLEDALLIFKRNAIYALIGSSPNSWQIVAVDLSIGCAGHNSIGHFGGRLFWMSLKGPRAMSSPGGGVIDISTPLVGNLFDNSSVNEDDLESSVLVGNTNQNYVGWAITPIGATANTTIIPFNYELNRWMSSGWDVVDVQSCAQVNDNDGRAWPMIADYGGYVYQLGVGTQDGLPSGQIRTNGTVTASTNTTVSNNLASWEVNGFANRYVTVYDPDSGLALAQRRKIVSNTTNTLTVTPAWTANPDIGAIYAIGGIMVDVLGSQRNGGGGPLYKKRIEFLFIEVESSTAGDNCQILVYKDGDTENPVLSRTLTIGTGAEWNTAVWNISEWATQAFIRGRIPIRTTGFNWQIRVLHLSTGTQLELQRTAVQWQTKTRKQGR